MSATTNRPERESLRLSTNMGTVALLILIGLLAGSHDPWVSSNSGIQRLKLAPSGSYYDYAVTILMENNGICDIVPSLVPGCGSTAVPAPYMLSLAQTYGLATHYTGVSHPSEPNYCSIFGGEFQNCATSDGVCCFQDPGPNLVDRLESAGLSWKAFAEDATNSGTCQFSPPRVSDHFPFLNFKDMNTPSRCSNFLSTTSPSDNELVNILNSANPPNYIWLTPNDQDNMHSSSVSIGDTYLQSLVPRILSSTLFTSQRAALFIVFDEGNDVCPSGASGDCVYSVWAGPATKRAYSSSTSFNHYSYLSTFEANWNLPNLTTNDASATPMTDFFGATSSGQLSASFTYAPLNPGPRQNVSFVASARGGTLPYKFSWNFGDSSSGTGSQPVHVYPNNGTYTVTLTVTDSQSGTATTTNTLTIGSSPTGCVFCSAALNFLSNTWTTSILAILGVTGAVTLIAVRTRKTLKEGDDEYQPQRPSSRLDEKMRDEEDEED